MYPFEPHRTHKRGTPAASNVSPRAEHLKHPSTVHLGVSMFFCTAPCTMNSGAIGTRRARDFFMRSDTCTGAVRRQGRRGRTRLLPLLTLLVRRATPRCLIRQKIAIVAIRMIGSLVLPGLTTKVFIRQPRRGRRSLKSLKSRKGSVGPESGSYCGWVQTARRRGGGIL
jgi:hypothetical protein